MRRRYKALVTGAAVLAAVPFTMPGAIRAVAASPIADPVEWLEYYNISTEDYAVAGYWLGADWPIYYAGILEVVGMPYVNGVPIDGDYEPTRYGGRYLRNGVPMFGEVFYHSQRYYQQGGASDPLPVFVGSDASMYVECIPASGNTNVQYNIQLSSTNTGHPRYYINSALARRDFFVNVTATGFDVASISATMSGAYFYDVYFGRVTSSSPAELPALADVVGFGGFPPSDLLGQSVGLPSLPGLDDFGPITSENWDEYIKDVYNPYMVEQYPDFAPYMYDPDAVDPEDPIYPTGETLQGIPKEWTVVNPQIPSPGNLDLQLPTADYSDADIVPIIEENSEGLGFWWSLLTYILEEFRVKSLVILALVCGLLVTVLTKLGR